MAKLPRASKDDCKEAELLRPQIDRNKCEGKSACVDVCPYDVFEVRVIDAADKQQLSLLGRIKSRVHGGKTAYTPRAADCHACGACVKACPEKAIKLVRAPAAG